jgi:CRISPR-associated protein Cas5h
MSYKDLLIFDIKGEYGHFRKYNTTTSPLTYSIPTRTSIVGILGAILGMERESCDGQFPEGSVPVQEFFSKEKTEIAIQVINPVKKENIGFNLINTKNSFYDLTRAGHTQVNFELLKNPHYRIFLSMNNHDKFEELYERIKCKNHHFTPYLGLAQFTAQVDFVMRAKACEEISDNTYIEIITAVNMSKLRGEPPVEFQREAFYSANNMPIEMNRDREVLEYSEVLIEKNGKPLCVRVSDYLSIDEIGNILFL